MLFVLLNINTTRKHVYNSYLSKIILERTAILSNTTKESYLAYEEINDTINACKKENSKKKCNADVANALIVHDVISKNDVEELIILHKLKGIDRKDLIKYD